MRTITGIIVHCTATRAEWRAGSKTSAKVSEVRKWHVRDNGWSDIGYHFLIDRDGTIAKGRPLEKTGAHVRGHNTGSIGIALFGGHGGSERDQFLDHYTPAQEIALAKLICDLRSQFPAITKVSGHNQFAAKACPCFQVPQWYKGGKERTLAQSTTLQAAGLSGAGVIGGAGAAISALDGTAQLVVIGAAILAAAGLAWIARERIRKWAAGDR